MRSWNSTMCLTIVIIETYLNASANFAGFIANKGSVKKATKKQTPAPSKQAPNPNSLQIAKVQKGKKIRHFIISSRFSRSQIRTNVEHTSPILTMQSTPHLHSSVLHFVGGYTLRLSCCRIGRKGSKELLKRQVVNHYCSLEPIGIGRGLLGSFAPL